jgi:hypothetical protein
MRRRLALAFLTLLAGPTAGCNVHAVERLAMTSAYRPVHDGGLARSSAAPPEPPRPAASYQLLAGDMHCHISPPDSPDDVTRGVAETIARAHDEALDFVVLTPHLPARFFADRTLRARAVAGQAELRRAFASAGVAGATVFIPGFEYTDHAFGHVNASFADLGQVLAEVPVDVARADPARFFERWAARGGLLVVNHPVVTPLHSIFARARADMSWRPWTSSAPYPPEIAAVGRLAVGFEAYNVAVAQLRDGLLLLDADLGLREVTGRLDREILTGRRRLAPVGGTDSHAGWLRAAMFVLAESRTEAGIRDALVGGRTCVRSPAACSLEVRPPGGAWVSVGGAVRSDATVEVRARGDQIAILRDGAPVALPASGKIAAVDVPAGRCSLIRARVDDGYSAPVYVNCDFAEAPR